MKVKLVTDIEIPALNLKLQKNTQLNVVEIRCNCYVCQSEVANCLYIPKEFCEVYEE